jgi:hypothetical protein
VTQDVKALEFVPYIFPRAALDDFLAKWTQDKDTVK